MEILELRLFLRIQVSLIIDRSFVTMMRESGVKNNYFRVTPGSVTTSGTHVCSVNVKGEAWWLAHKGKWEDPEFKDRLSLHN